MGVRSHLIVALLVAAGVPVLAHHSFAAFDQSREVTLIGQVIQFQWTNPHSWLVVKVKGASGQDEEWSFKDGTHFGLMLTVLDAEGHPIGGKVEK